MFDLARFGVQEWDSDGHLDIKVGGVKIGLGYIKKIDDTIFKLWIAITKDAVPGIGALPLPLGHDYLFETTAATRQYSKICDWYCDVVDDLPTGTHIQGEWIETFVAHDCECE